MTSLDFFTLILKGLILGLLLIGTDTDLKTRTVSNKITFAILILCIPLIYLNKSIMEYFPVYFVSITALLIAYYFLYNTQSRIGGADLKVLIPLMASFSIFQFIGFFSVISIVTFLMWFKWKSGMPFFVAISISYLIVMI